MILHFNHFFYKINSALLKQKLLPPSIIGSFNVKSKTSLLNSSLSIFKANTIDVKPENNNIILNLSVSPLLHT